LGQVLIHHRCSVGVGAEALRLRELSACAESDPEFQRVVTAFQRGFDWNTLVRAAVVADHHQRPPDRHRRG
jgi:hypothetical protein